MISAAIRKRNRYIFRSVKCSLYLQAPKTLEFFCRLKTPGQNAGQKGLQLDFTMKFNFGFLGLATGYRKRDLWEIVFLSLVVFLVECQGRPPGISYLKRI